jgi:hypothetical protein
MTHPTLHDDLFISHKSVNLLKGRRLIRQGIARLLNLFERLSSALSSRRFRVAIRKLHAFPWRESVPSFEKSRLYS